MVLAIFYKVIFETSTKRKFFSRSTASATQIIEHGESILLILFDITFATTDLLLGGSFFHFSNTFECFYSCFDRFVALKLVSSLLSFFFSVLSSNVLL